MSAVRALVHDPSRHPHPRGAPLPPLLAPVLVLAMLAPAAPVAAAGTTTLLAADFDAGATDWYVAAGSATLATVNDPKSEGDGALQVAYDVTAASLQIAPRSSAIAAELPGLPRRMTVDVHGDGSWNVLYLQLRDATGEIFHYRLGNVSFTGWQTLAIEPGRSSPATTMSGDGDGILDLPIHVFKLVLDRNPGGLASASTIAIDRLAYEYESVDPLTATPNRFVPSAGQSGKVTVSLQEAASVSAVLTDEAGRVRTFAASVAAGSSKVLAWNGKSDAGALMTGSVTARLSVDRAAATSTYDLPYLAGLPARYEKAIPASIVGINSALTAINTSARTAAESQARLMEGAWIRMARESFDWNRVEPRKGWYDWAKFDQAVEVARAHNVDLLGRLEYSAGWASSAPSSTTAAERVFYPPDSNADFAAYARAVVRRYKDRIKVWEIWNEPNAAAFWKPRPSPAAYASLLRAAYVAIKAEDPGATVVLGGTVGFDRAFMDGIVAAGAWDSFDALAIHTYVAPQPESSMVVTWLDNARAYVAAKGVKPIWITEFGWSTYTGSGSGYIGVSEARQAEYVARTYLHAARVGVRGVFAYSLIENGTSATSRLDNYGLVEQGGRQKPAYGALRRVAEPLDQGTTAGIADPNAAGRTTIDAFETPTGWRAAPLGGGSASIASTTTRHGGAAALKLTYGFTASSSGVELVRNLPVAGSPTTISVWAYGDDSANPVYLKIADRTGETFQAAIGSLLGGWQRMTLYMDGADINWKASGGDADGIVDYPVTIKSLFVFRGGIGKLSGSAVFDDLQVETGPRVRGVIVSRRNGVSQALYTLGPASTVAVPVSGTSAWRIDGSSSTGLAVNGGKVSVRVGALPVNVLSAAGLSPTTITPDGDGLDDRTTMTWIAGDRTTYTFQVFNAASGALLRTVTTAATTDAGLRAVTWDGRISGALAVPRVYRLRIAIHGPDDRVSYLLKDVTVR